MIGNLPFVSGFRLIHTGLLISLFGLAGCQSLEKLGQTQAQTPAVPSEKSQSVAAKPGPGQSVPAPADAQAEDQGKILPPGATPRLPSFLPMLNGPAGAVGTRAEDAPRVPPPATTDTVRIAILLPLSGAHADIGKSFLKAAQLALFDFADSRFELLPHDTRGTPEGAQRAARIAIGDRVSVILGPLLSASVNAITPAARAANVPVLAFSNDRSIAGNGIYTLGFLPSEQIIRVTRFASSKGMTRFAALAPDNAYGGRVVETFRRTVDALGGRVTQVTLYDPAAQDFTDVIREFANYGPRRQALLNQRKLLHAQNDEISKRALKRLKNLQTLGDLPFEALLVADGGKRLMSVAALLPFFDIDPNTVRMLGTGQWDEPGIGKEPALVGGWYAAPPAKARATFNQQYLDIYGTRPPRLVTMAYDAMALVAVLGRQLDEADFSAQALTNPNGFWGRDGIFRLTDAGTTERGLVITQIGRDANQVISEAPETFDILIN